MLSRSKAPKRRVSSVTNIREKPVNFFHGADFSTRNNFTNLGSFFKSFRSSKIYNSLIHCRFNREFFFQLPQNVSLIKLISYRTGSPEGPGSPRSPGLTNPITSPGSP